MTTVTLFAFLATTAHADPIAEIIEGRDNFLNSAPVQVEPEPLDLETYLLGLSANPTLALIQQIEGTGNQVEIRQQDGINDIVAAFQGFGDNNQASISQTGSGNFAVLSQTGNDNQVQPLEQLGNDNIARLTQIGSNNRAEVHQLNDGNELNLRQTDDYNDALVNQFGGAALEITQENPGGSQDAVNGLSVSAYVEPGFTSNFGPINLTGPGQTAVTLCTGSAGFCDQY
ncbi:MAG: hypothetical protein ACT4PZ_10050 [Panacagrimonas sp.]